MISPSTAIYHAIWHRITPKHQAKTTLTKTRPPCCGLPFALAPGLYPFLALSPAWPILLSFSCPSGGHIIELTVPPANINPVPSRLGLLPECMIVYVAFFCFSLPLSPFPSCYIYIYRMVSASTYPKHFVGGDMKTYRKHENIAWYTEKSWYDTE